MEPPSPESELVVTVMPSMQADKKTVTVRSNKPLVNFCVLLLNSFFKIFEIIILPKLYPLNLIGILLEVVKVHEEKKRYQS